MEYLLTWVYPDRFPVTFEATVNSKAAVDLGTGSAVVEASGDSIATAFLDVTSLILSLDWDRHSYYPGGINKLTNGVLCCQDSNLRYISGYIQLCGYTSSGEDPLHSKQASACHMVAEAA